MIRVKELLAEELVPDMLMNFEHRQRITDIWVQRNGEWKLEARPSLREWDGEKRRWIAGYIRQQIERGGACIAAYDGDVLIGFACLDGLMLGKTGQYANLTMLFVDDKWKRRGIGRGLFEKMIERAAAMKADKLFISAIPSVETVSFYFSMGCKDAVEMIPSFVDTENDRYLEYDLRHQK